MKRKERRERRQYQWDKKGVGKRKVDKIEKGCQWKRKGWEEGLRIKGEEKREREKK